MIRILILVVLLLVSGCHEDEHKADTVSNEQL